MSATSRNIGFGACATTRASGLAVVAAEWSSASSSCSSSAPQAGPVRTRSGPRGEPDREPRTAAIAPAACSRVQRRVLARCWSASRSSGHSPSPIGCDESRLRGSRAQWSPPRDPGIDDRPFRDVRARDGVAPGRRSREPVASSWRGGPDDVDRRGRSGRDDGAFRPGRLRREEGTEGASAHRATGTMAAGGRQATGEQVHVGEAATAHDLDAQPEVVVRAPDDQPLPAPA